ncbi:MAG: hypothetical protein H0U46_01565 [Actinobacteria bacterium]|nr:hypothetical protein [Actinomycetota bacterium]
MRQITAALTLIGALLAGGSAAHAADIGANDDTGKYLSDGGATLYGDMSGLGLRQIVLTSRYKPSDPLTIQDKELLDRAIPAAAEAGLRVVLAVYPYPPREVVAGLASPGAFGAYTASVAQAYPQVKQFVVGNEPNQPAFWRPQFATSGANASAPAFGRYLAAAYDALKAVDPEIKVIGVGLSPRGNDRPDAKSNISTSPVRFLRALGAWYRASGRALPLMDGFSFHPYPNAATDPLDRGYQWPNAGFVNLDRIKQALWDAFNGTAQPTTVDGLGLYLDEVGWQVSTAGEPGYTELENVAVTDELTQAALYADLVRRAACDEDVVEVSFFGFRDDGSRIGFQAALQRLDGSARPAAEAVRAAIADVAAAGCASAAVAWAPSVDVLDSSVTVERTANGGLGVRLAAGEDARALVCVGSSRPGGIRGRRVVKTRGAHCRSVTLVGRRPLVLAVELSGAIVPGATRITAEIGVELVAEANSARRTARYHRATLAPLA